MSLRVWLPLNGDLRNNGLDNIEVVNNGATVDNNGKIGKCYNFSGSSQYLRIDSKVINTSEYSISFWMYAANISANHCIFSTRNVNSGAVNIYQLAAGIRFDNGVTWQTGFKPNINTWYHIVCTQDATSQNIYVNGELNNQRTGTTTLSQVSSVCTIGCEHINGGSIGTYFKGKLNDFRIYDHALSAKEVKELSKGLVCHYPLNDIKGQENLFNWGNKGNKIITLNNYQNTGSFTQFSSCLTFDAKDTIGTTYTISFWAKSPNGTTSLLLYNNNSTPRYFYFSPTTLTTSLNNEWQYFTYTFTNQDRGSGTTTASTYNRIEIYMPSQMGGQVKLIKIEEGEKATSWSPAPSDTYYNKLGYNKNIIYDTSGYNYHGINYNSTISSNSSKYNVSTFFDGSNSYIEFDNLDFMANMLPDEWSFSFWVFNQDSGDRSILFSNYGLGGVGGASFGFEKTTNELLRVAYNNGTFDKVIPNSTLIVNDWTHIIVTKTKEHLISVYRNGVFIHSYTNDKCNSLGKIYRLGKDSRSDSTMFKGGISDFRIYSTVLSEDDAKELYQVGASIDKNGNVFAYEFKED